MVRKWCNRLVAQFANGSVFGKIRHPANQWKEFSQFRPCQIHAIRSHYDPASSNNGAISSQLSTEIKFRNKHTCVVYAFKCYSIIRQALHLGGIIILMFIISHNCTNSINNAFIVLTSTHNQLDLIESFAIMFEFEIKEFHYV